MSEEDGKVGLFLLIERDRLIEKATVNNNNLVLIANKQVKKD